jgi:dihydroorotate dehydrogenase
LKVAPDLEPNEIETISELLLSHRFDAVIAGNTTITRPINLISKHSQEIGGLSGAPLRDISTQVIAQFYKHLKGQVNIIGVGGIASAEDAWDKLVAGADYLQVYSMFIYLGPIMIRDIVAGLSVKVHDLKCKTLAEALTKVRN